MNDRFKFRAWNKQNEYMCFDIQECEGSYECNYCFSYYLDNDSYIVLQCTGLKDKNGKYIYEKDIVKWGDHCDICREIPIRIAEVKIAPDIQFDAKNINQIFHFGSFAYQDTSHLEIIGNIYENPKLLTK